MDALRPLSLALIVVAAALAGCADDAPDPESLEQEVTGPAPTGPHTVLGVIDTGINPYHVTFRDESPLAWQYPGTYIPDYPAGALPLNLSLDEEDYWEAVQKDCEDVWAKVEPGQLYWVPGTKIVGAIYFEGESTDCSGDEPAVGGILDRNGHGTMTASRATSVEYGACPDVACRVVAIQFPASIGAQDRVDGVEVAWAASNATWIDGQSNSWGPFLPVPFPEGAPQQYVGDSPELSATIEASGQAHMSFWASMNGALGRFGAAGHPTLLSTHLTPSIVMVGGHDSGRINTWPGFPPHVVSDSCSSWAAYWDSIDGSAEDVGGGTSGATPFAAGGAMRILLEARALLNDTRTGVHDGVVASGDPGNVTEGPLADGNFTLAELREVLFKTATARPARQYEDGSVCEALYAPYNSTPIEWTQVPAGAPEFLLIGYGAVDNESLALANEVLTGAAPLPDRGTTDTYFMLDDQARRAVYDAYQLLG